uniref:Ig-like domain-containing protein n=1 Tax=Cyprinodon variegatus TaxID=28743 RepID=A0A3Q2EDI7_CYPVA
MFSIIFADSLVPVVTVQLGESVTLPCAFTEKFQSTTWLHWYKQSAGDNLKLIVMQQKSIKPNYGPDVSASKIEATNDEKFSNITIQKTVIQDEGMYHCAHMDWTKSTWTGTYLSIKDFSRTSRYNVLQNPTTDAARSANSETLQCSLLSGSEDKMCSGELNVFWFRAGSEKSYPDIIHSNENGLHNCEKTSTLNTQRKCSYNLSKNFSSTDTQTVYCAVATCGEILFGKGTLTKAGIVIIIPCSERISENELDLNYAALHFSGIKKQKEKKKRELKTEESVYSQVLHEHAK